MKKIIEQLLQIIIIIILILLFIQPCNIGTETVKITDTIWMYDTTWVFDTIDATEYPDPEVIVVTKWKYYPVDTAAILADWHNKKVYNRTLVNDSNLTFELNDTIQKNKIMGSAWKYKINRPTQIIENKTIYADKWRLSGGAHFNTFPSSDNLTVIDLGPTLSFSLNKMTYTIQYGLINRGLQIGVQYTFLNKKGAK